MPRDRILAAPGLVLAALLAIAAGAATSHADVPAATAQSPCGGEVYSSTVVLVAGNAAGPGAPYRYHFELYSDAGMTIPIATTPSPLGLIPEGAGGSTAWLVPVTVPENGRLFWRVRAFDGTAFGPFSTCQSVVNAVNEQPSAPQLLSPAFGAQVDSFQPTLRIGNASDPDHDVLRYQLEVSPDPGMAPVIAHTPIGGIAAGAGGATTWPAPAAYQEDHLYYWRARAIDPGGLTSDWSPTGAFFVTTTNAAPEVPGLLFPQNGTAVGVLRPTLMLLEGGDPDMDPLVYDWQLARAADFGDLIQLGDNVAPAATPTFPLTADLEEDEAYCWRARADDGQVTSAWAVACFRVSTGNDPPTTPAPTTPSAAGVAATTTPVFAWAPSIDPEGAAVTYAVTIEDDVGHLVATVEGVAGTVTYVAQELVDGQRYTWQVRATDSAGATSAPSPARTFTVAVPVDHDGGCCTADGGCHASGPTGAGTLAAVGLPLALTLLGRRRRQDRAGGPP